MTEKEANRLVSINAHLYSSNQFTSLAANPSALQRYQSSTLLNGEKEVIILHTNQEYRLRHTKKGKLILTK